MNFILARRAAGSPRFSPIDPKGSTPCERFSERTPMASDDRSDEIEAIRRAARDLDDSGQ
jgi:hypothetical protein